jgi:hypothetical protein
MKCLKDSFGCEVDEREYCVFGTAYPGVDVTLTRKGWATEDELIEYGGKHEV